MTRKNVSQSSDLTQTIFAALCVIVALVGSCWFLAYRVYTTGSTTETITVQLPPGVVAGKPILIASPEPEPQVSNTASTVEVVREKPGRQHFSALLHPFGFGVLMLMIIGAGGGLILLVVWLDGGARDG